MIRYQTINGETFIRAADVLPLDALDLQGDSIVDPTGEGELYDPTPPESVTILWDEYAEVIEPIVREPGCILIHTSLGSFGFPPDHLIKAKAVLYACGICDQYHPNGFHGDCRDDSNRIADPDELFGADGWYEIAMEDAA